MAINFDWSGKVVEVTTSITDLVAFHALLREAESSAMGATYPVIHQWRALSLGGGATFYQLDFINGWRLKFPNSGSYTITGNLNADILAVPGVYVERQTSAAFTTVSAGGSGGSGGTAPTVDAIATAVLNALQTTVLPVDLRFIKGKPLQGTGQPGDEFGVMP